MVGTVLLPVGTVNEDAAAAVISEKDSVALVYCRSKAAFSALAELGCGNTCKLWCVLTSDNTKLDRKLNAFRNMAGGNL